MSQYYVIHILPIVFHPNDVASKFI